MTEVQNVFANRRVGLVPVFSGVVFGYPLRHVGDELVQPLTVHEYLREAKPGWRQQSDAVRIPTGVAMQMGVPVLAGGG
jgi:hypothetical protein